MSGLRLLRNQDGGLAIQFGLMLPVLLVFVGFAIDLTRYSFHKMKVLGAADGAVLAATNFDVDDGQDVADSYFRDALGQYENTVVSVAYSDGTEIDADPEDANLSTLEVVTTFKPYFLRILGVNEMDIGTVVKALNEKRSIEVSLVLDISGSMTGSKIDELKSAVENFIVALDLEVSNENKVVNLIPFAMVPQLETARSSFLAPSPHYETYIRPSDRFKFQGCFDFEPDDLSDRALVVNSELMPWGACNQRVGSIWASNNETDLVNHVRNIRTEMGTYASPGITLNTEIASGVAWGVKSLSPDFQNFFHGPLGASFPKAYLPVNKKVLVILTDGVQQPHNRWNDSFWFGQILPSDIFLRASVGQAEAATARMCSEAKQNGITVFTISYDLSGSAHVASQMEACATSSDHFYEAEQSELVATFEALGDRLRPLVLVK